MRVGRVCADQNDDVGMLDRIEILRARRSAECVGETIAGRRVAYPRARINVVIAEAAADELLHQERLLIGAARRRDAANRSAAIGLLDALEFRRNPADRLVPRHLAPRLGDLLTHHRLEDAFLVVSVTPGETPLDAGMAAVGLAVLEGHHSHDFLAVHLGLERAADAAIRTRRHHGAISRSFDLLRGEHALFEQRAGRTRLHAGAARHAFRLQKRLAHAGRHDGVEAAAGNRQRESALHLLAGANAARADDAFRRIVDEIRIGIVDARIRMADAIEAITDFLEADFLRGVEQIDVAVLAAVKRVDRMVGDVELHHTLADAVEPLSPSVHYEAGRNRRGAGGWSAAAAIDLDQAQPAGTKRLQHVGGA